jgi:hypothetical protein
MGRRTKEETRHKVEKERRCEVTTASVRWRLSRKDCSNSTGMQAIFVGCRESANEALERRKVKPFPDLLNSSSFHIYFITNFVFYSYNESQQDALFLNFIFINNSTCFGQNYCPSSGVLILYSQQLVFVILVC